MAPIIMKIRQMRPEMPIAKLIALVNMALASMPSLTESNDWLPIRAIRIPFKMILARRTIARPIKARVNTLRLAAALPGSPEETI